MNIIGVIPARYSSTRLAGKPLAEIAGKSMIRRVFERCAACRDLSQVVVATDHIKILQEVESFGGKAIMTDPELPSGTDRVAAAVKNAGLVADAVVNIQGDEPFIDPRQISEVCSLLRKPEVEIATLAHPIQDLEEIYSPNVVKVTITRSGKALYFSRSPIPFQRKTTSLKILRHVGIYGFKLTVLNNLVQLTPSDLEVVESLEQLRWLENDFTIHVGITRLKSFGIDTAAHLQEAIEFASRMKI